MDEEIFRHYPHLIQVKRRPAWVTWLLVGSTAGVFLLQLAYLQFQGRDVIGDSLAFGPRDIAEHRYWTLLTYAWVHAVSMFGDSGFFWLHIVSNMVPLVFFGPMLERLLGHARFLGLYLGGAIASALAWYLFDSNGEVEGGIIGASGAVFALIAALGTALPRERVLVLLFFVVPLSMNLRVMALVICGGEVMQMIFHWLPEVAHSAHLGGAAFGFLYVILFRPRSTPNHLPH